LAFSSLEYQDLFCSDHWRLGCDSTWVLLRQAGSRCRFTYGAFARVRTFTDSEGWTVTYDYDAADRVTKVTYPDWDHDKMRSLFKGRFVW
jgi:YD repeat-containing protein